MSRLPPRRVCSRWLVLTLISACSVHVLGEESACEVINDPFEPLNRKVLIFNYVADTVALRPASNVYRRLVPRFVREGIRNFIDNLDEPRTAINQLLQGKPRAAISDTTRFLVNTSIGIGGLFDPATAMGLQHHKEDFGQTLARWRVPQGPYVVIPVIGSSTLRDGVMKIADGTVSPTTFLANDRTRIGLGILDRIDSRSRDTVTLDDLGEDPYEYIKDAYLRQRSSEIYTEPVRDAESQVESSSEDDVDSNHACRRG